MSKKLFAVLIILLLVFSIAPAAVAQAPFTVQTITISDMPAYDMLVSPDGRIAALYTGDFARNLLGIPVMEYVVDERLLPIRLIDLTTGNEVGQLRGHTDYAGGLAFTPDGRQLASYHLNGDIYLWDLESRLPVRRMAAIMGRMKIEFLPDGHTLVAYTPADRLGQFLLWDMETGYMTGIWRTPYQSFGDMKLSRPPENFDYYYIASDISPDGTLMATATGNGELKLWDTATLQQTVVRPRESEDNLMHLNIRSLAFSADSRTLVYYNTITEQTHFWDIVSRRETAALSLGGMAFGLSSRGDRLAWATRDELWVVYLDQPNLATKVLDWPESLLVAGMANSPTITFTPDGSRFIVGGFAVEGLDEGNYGDEDSVLYVITLNE